MITRRTALDALSSEHFDVAVIGGGVTGAGVALDASSRGLSVALCERDDYACGTSSRSSKLIHGGLRYLQSFDLGLVREALVERALMVEHAPHLVTPLAMLVPAFDGKHPGRRTGVGLNMYDVMATRPKRPWEREEYWSPERHRIISGERACSLVPALEPRQPSSAYLFYDCQTDDARLCLTVLGEAERFGAVCCNQIEVTGLVRSDSRARGVECVDRMTGSHFSVRADNVINATGAWADRLEAGDFYATEEVVRMQPSRGTHVVLPRNALAADVGVIVPAPEGRTIFVLPWGGRTLVGTTDNDYRGPLDHVPPGEEDIAYLLEACNSFFGLSLDRGDLTGAYAGVRPLIASGDRKRSVDISRRAELYETGSGVVTITGGKLTTWRTMAAMAVDHIVERAGREARSRTAEIPLGLPVEDRELSHVDGVTDETRALLASRYGYAAKAVVDIAAGDRRLAQRICPDLPDLLAEAVFAARYEQAQSVADVLLRRTRLGVVAAVDLVAPKAPAVKAVAKAMAQELGWDRARTRQQIADWRAVAASEGIDPR